MEAGPAGTVPPPTLTQDALVLLSGICDYAALRGRKDFAGVM